MTKDEALKLTLEALEHEADKGNDDAYKVERDAIKEALAQPEQEPVVFNTLASLKHKKTVGPIERAMLNATPPQRTWVGLTDEEIQYCVELKNPEAIAEEVEAKLKEKNT